jgi:hypothetical protein
MKRLRKQKSLPLLSCALGILPYFLPVSSCLFGSALSPFHPRPVVIRSWFDKLTTNGL